MNNSLTITFLINSSHALDSIGAYVFLLIQSFLPKSRITKSSGDKKKFYSIEESRNAFMMIYATDVEYKQKYGSKLKAETSIAPYITIIGTLNNPVAFMVDFDNISYKLYSLGKAIDVCFKAFHLFNIKYPDACSHLWDFLNREFYKIPSNEKATPATSKLLKNIQSKCFQFTFNFRSKLYNIFK